MLSRPSVLPLVVPLLLLPGALSGKTSHPCAPPTAAGGPLRDESPDAGYPVRAAPGDTVRVMVGPVAHLTIPDGPLDSSALTEAVAAHLRAEPGIEVVEPGEGVSHMVTSSVTQDPNGRARIQVGLVRVADGIVVRRRAVDVTLGPEETPLARRIADEVLRLLEEAGLRP